MEQAIGESTFNCHSENKMVRSPQTELTMREIAQEALKAECNSIIWGRKPSQPKMMCI